MSPPILDPIRGALLRSQPDARLVALTREGRERAFEEIVRRYRAPLVGFAAMIVPPDRADDVVQESLIRAFDALRASDGEIQLRAWLFRIVRNRALNDVRDTPVHDELTEELDASARPEDVAERREEIAALLGGLKALPDAQREAIVARELEGRGHAEIAAELGTSPGAVRQLIFRARGTLRSAMGLLVPLPLLRLLLGPGGAEAAATAGAGAGAAAAMTGGGLAGGAAGKVAIGLAGIALAVGGGLAVERGRHSGDRAEAASGGGSGDRGENAPAPKSREAAARAEPGSDDGRRRGGEDTDGSGDSGRGSGAGENGGGSSGHGGGGERHGGDDDRDEAEEFEEPEDTVHADEDEDEDSSGPGGSGSSGSGSGSGGDDDLEPAEVDPPEDDSSGSGSGSGSGSSGSSGSGPDDDLEPDEL